MALIKRFENLVFFILLWSILHIILIVTGCFEGYNDSIEGWADPETYIEGKVLGESSYYIILIFLPYWIIKLLTSIVISIKNKSFKPNYFVDISKSIKFKLKALKYYKREMRKWPHPRSIEGVKLLSKTRGSSVGLPHAEAFILGRHVEK